MDPVPEGKGQGPARKSGECKDVPGSGGGRWTENLDARKEMTRAKWQSWTEALGIAARWSIGKQEMTARGWTQKHQRTRKLAEQPRTAISNSGQGAGRLCNEGGTDNRMTPARPARGTGTGTGPSVLIGRSYPLELPLALRSASSDVLSKSSPVSQG